MDETEVSCELDHFRNLSLANCELKFKSVLKILYYFHKQESLDEKMAVVRRLIRGLGATKHELRQGHYASFSCLLKQLPKNEFDFNVLHNLILKTLSPCSTSKQETGEAYLGQVLGYSTLVHSDFLNDQSDNMETVALALIELSMKRSYLLAQCYECLCILISKVPKEFITENFLLQLKSLESNTLDKLQYLMYLQNSFPETNTISAIFGTKKLLSVTNAPKVAELIMKSCSNYKSDHLFYGSFCTKIAKKIRFTTSFLSHVCKHVEPNLKKDKPSFTLIETYLKICSNLLKQVLAQYLDPNYVDIIVSDLLLNIIKEHGRKHLKLVLAISDSLCAILSNGNEEKKLCFVKKVLFHPGCLSFDNCSGTKIASNLINMLGASSVEEVVGCLRKIIENKSNTNKERLIAFYMFCRFLNHSSCYENIDWRLNGLKFLLHGGFYMDRNYNVEFAGLIKNAFYSQISNRFPSLAAYTQVLKALVSYIDEGFIKKLLRTKIDPDLAGAWKHAMKLEKHIENHISTGNNDILQSIYVLSLYMCLNLLKERDDTKINLQDIESIFLKVTKDSSKYNNDGPKWIEVMMDLFLNLLSKPHSSHRHIISCVFKYLAPHLNEQAFTQIVNVLSLSWTHTVFEDGRQADEVSDSSSDTSFEDFDNDDETEETDANAKNDFQQVLYGILGQKDEDVKDMDDVDMDVDQIGQEEGERLNEALAQAFKLTKMPVAYSKNTRESNNMFFQIKVLDLVECLAKEGMNCSKWLTLIPAVLNLLKKALEKKQDELSNKLKSTIKKIAGSKVISGGTKKEKKEVVTLLKHLLTQALAGSGVNAELRPYLSMFSVFLIKNFTKGGIDRSICSSEIKSLLITFIDEYFYDSKSHLSSCFFKSLCQSCWFGMTQLVGRIAEHSASGDVKIHKRIEALKLLKCYFNNTRFFQSAAREWEDSVKKCSLIILNFDEEGSGSVNSKYYIALWNLIIILFKSKASPCIQWDKWKALIQSTVFNSRKPVIKKKEMKRFKRMCTLLAIPEELFLSKSSVSIAPIKQKKKRTFEDIKETSTDTSQPKLKLSKPS